MFHGKCTCQENFVVVKFFFGRISVKTPIKRDKDKATNFPSKHSQK